MRDIDPRPAHERTLALWLLICCAMIFAMVVLGGVTRLTGSGLSMVQWDPIFGVVPPLSQAEWQTVFDQYRASPEYQKVNMHMEVEDFKSIYWFEFAHRLLGRTIGTVFLLPFLYFLWRGWVRRPLIPKLVGMFVLGGLQGVLGWYMVASGLVDNPHVSHYRLTAHLLLAFLIYGFIFWTALDLLQPSRATDATLRPRLRTGAWLFLILVMVTVSSGGLVAGLKAGFAYSTFPLMDGHLVPEVIFLLEPRWRNFFENIATVQFDHRLLATTGAARRCHVVVECTSPPHRAAPTRASAARHGRRADRAGYLHTATACAHPTGIPASGRRLGVVHAHAVPDAWTAEP